MVLPPLLPPKVDGAQGNSKIFLNETRLFVGPIRKNVSPQDLNVLGFANVVSVPGGFVEGGVSRLHLCV